MQGRLVDRETQEPIVGAHVAQVYRSGTWLGSEPRVVEARWTETDAEGRFVFVADVATGSSSLAGETYGPRYDFFHPEYGLVRGPTIDTPELILEGSRENFEQRSIDLQTLCHARDDDPASRHLHVVACANTKQR